MSRLLVRRSREEAAAQAADIILTCVALRPRAVVGLATGATQAPVFAEIVRRSRADGISFRQVTFFHLDEYCGLPPDHRLAMARELARSFLDLIDAVPERLPLLDGNAADPVAEACRYEMAIRDAGGIDLQILGLGANGHIAFNEPGSPIESRTRVVTLSSETRARNRAGLPAGEMVPKRALSLGIATILEARAILLVAAGADKAQALRAAIEGPETTSCPASALRRHPGLTIVADRDAAAGLTRVSGSTASGLRCDIG
ncbi:MAG: glucosamine-6-phosphate deaminase [Dongiaceae bacterium]